MTPKLLAEIKQLMLKPLVQEVVQATNKDIFSVNTQMFDMIINLRSVGTFMCLPAKSLKIQLGDVRM